MLSNSSYKCPIVHIITARICTVLSIMQLLFLYLNCVFSSIAVPQPTMNIAVPPGPLYTGTNVTITCNIALNSRVDSVVMVAVTWTGPSGVMIASNERYMLSDVSMTTESPPTFQATLTFTPLIQANNGIYTCQATASPDPELEFMTSSPHGSGVGTVTVQGRLICKHNSTYVPILSLKLCIASNALSFTDVREILM